MLKLRAISNSAQSNEALEQKRSSGSVLDLFHPDGFAENRLVLGTARVKALGNDHGSAYAQAEVILISPTSAECKQKGFIEGIVRDAAEKLASNGILYVLAPARSRWRLRALLRAYGFVLETPMLHLPNAAVSRYFVPLDPAAAPPALDLILRHRALRTIAALAFRLPGMAALSAYGMPAVGFVARRAGSRASFEWLFGTDAGSSRRAVVVRRSWRPEASSVVLHCWSGDAYQTRRIAKISEGCGEPVEAISLAGAAAAAAGAGARVPSLIGVRKLRDRSALLESELRGRPAAVLLRSRPDRFRSTLGRVATWLERWNAATIQKTVLQTNDIVNGVLADLEVIRPWLRNGDIYCDWLAGSCEAIGSAPLPVVTCHKDLTMWNVLIHKDDPLGIIDWEGCRSAWLPMTDYFYAAADAAAAVHGYADRPKAFYECFHEAGALRSIVAFHKENVVRELGFDANLIPLCFHACWVHHAANEQRWGDSRDRPFMAILRMIATTPVAIPEVRV